MSVRDALLAIRDEHGYLTPALVVDTARPVEHPLHERFEWDDSAAGEAWRRHQASQLIRSCRIVYTTADEGVGTVRAFHSVRGASGRVYEPADDVAADPVLSELVLRDMQRDWFLLKRRWGAFAEFVAMVRRDLDGGELAS